MVVDGAGVFGYVLLIVAVVFALAVGGGVAVVVVVVVGGRGVTRVDDLAGAMIVVRVV